MTDTWDEVHMQALTEQITAASLGLSRAATLMERLRNAVLLIGAACSTVSFVVPLPSAFGDCQSTACAAGLVVGIVTAFISTVLTLVDGKINAGESAASLHLCAQAMMRLGRSIDTELHKAVHLREPFSQFLGRIVTKYDGIVKNLESVPQFCLNQTDIVNLTLLRRYSVVPP